MSDDEIIDLDKVEDWSEHVPLTRSIYLKGPPGTGKTTTSAARVANLDEEHDEYTIDDVVWCTYRRSLAEETLERFVKWDILDEGALDEMHVGTTRYLSTAHAVGSRLLNDALSPTELNEYYGVDLDRDNPRVETASDWQRAEFCEKWDLTYGSAPDEDDSPGELLFDALQWLRENLYDPREGGRPSECDAYRELIRDHGWKGSLSTVYEEWQAYKQEYGVIDFCEQLSEPLRHGLVPPGRILVVDEFHDATPLLAKLTLFWADNMDITIIAGDQDQIVNAYQGPSRELFSIAKEKLGLEEVLLDTSYRVPRAHWEAATEMLGQAHTPPDIDVRPGGRINMHNSPLFQVSDRSEDWGRVPNPDDESGPVDIHDSTEGSLMYLARTQLQVRGICAALDEDGVIYRAQKDIAGWTDTDRLDLYNALVKIDTVDPTANSAYSFGAVSTIDDFDDADTDTGDPMEDVVLTPEEADALVRYTPADHLEGTRDDLEVWREDVKDAGLNINVERVDESVLQPSFWVEFTDGGWVGMLEDTLKSGGDLDESDKETMKRAWRRYGDEVDEDDIRATARTIHASKGTEARHVVLYDGITGRIEQEMADDDAEFENEMRTWYVALTRAKGTLHVMKSAGWTSTGFTEILPTNLSSRVRDAVDADEDTSADASADD